MVALDREEFAQARHTLASGEQDRQEEEYDWASCKAHQAAEYALKGLLRGLGRPTFGHALLRLIQALREAGVEVPEEVEKAAKGLDLPAVIPTPTREEAPTNTTRKSEPRKLWRQPGCPPPG